MTWVEWTFYVIAGVATFMFLVNIDPLESRIKLIGVIFWSILWPIPVVIGALKGCAKIGQQTGRRVWSCIRGGKGDE